jgi:hypothetical protein
VVRAGGGGDLQPVSSDLPSYDANLGLYQESAWRNSTRWRDGNLDERLAVPRGIGDWSAVQWEKVERPPIAAVAQTTAHGGALPTVSAM